MYLSLSLFLYPFLSSFLSLARSLARCSFSHGVGIKATTTTLRRHAPCESLCNGGSTSRSIIIREIGTVNISRRREKRVTSRVASSYLLVGAPRSRPSESIREAARTAAAGRGLNDRFSLAPTCTDKYGFNYRDTPILPSLFHITVPSVRCGYLNLLLHGRRPESRPVGQLMF